MNTEGVGRVAVFGHDTSSCSSRSLFGITKNAGRPLRCRAVTKAWCRTSASCLSRRLGDSHGVRTLADEALLLIIKSLHTDGLLLLGLLLANEEVGKTSQGTNGEDNH